MKRYPLFLIFASLLGFSFGEEFKVDDVIHPLLKELGEPEMREGFGEGFMAISTSSDLAAKHVSQGMTRLNTSWDFEAYRHFVAAAKLDPDCLMAYWGITMSLAGSQHEFFDQRQRALDRMLDLMEWEQKEKALKWTELERGYAQAAGRLLTEGARAAGEAFLMISERFPNDIQAELFSYFLLRDGFDGFGKPKLWQKKSSEGLFKVLKMHPENVSVMAFWVATQTEAPLNGPQMRADVLPIARKLVRLYPDYAPFQLMLTHSEAHCGNAEVAINAGKKAVALFESYMAKEKVFFYDCESWVRAKLYLVNLYETKGSHAMAVELATELGLIKVEKERVFSRGAGMLMWEGRTAGARIMMGQADEASFKEGQKLLELLEEDQWFKDESLVIYYRDCLAFYLAGRIAVSKKELGKGKALLRSLTERAAAFEKRRPVAEKTSSFSSWLRATNLLDIGVAELRGMLAELEPEPVKSTALNWYRAGIDRQFRPSNLLPPVIDYPIQVRLGDFYLRKGDAEAAGRAYRAGLEIRQNHLTALKGYHKALVKLGKTESAEILAKRIKAVAN